MSRAPSSILTKEQVKKVKETAAQVLKEEKENLRGLKSEYSLCKKDLKRLEVEMRKQERLVIKAQKNVDALKRKK